MSAVLKQIRQQPNTPTTTVETITPEMARQWLAANTMNRPINQSRIIQHAERMDAGLWRLNGETIKFMQDGRLIDGQHRLMACDLAGVPFQSLVVRGITDELAFATVDCGEVRTHADILHIGGFKDQSIVAAAATILYHYDKGAISVSSIGTARKALPKETLLAYATPHKYLLESAAAWIRQQQVSKLVSPSVAAASLLLFARKNREQAERFLIDLGEGAGLEKTDPVYRLRERIIAQQGANEKLTRAGLLTLMVTAWNKRRAGEKVKNLVMPTTFPKVK